MNRRVLLVDDDKMILRGYERQLDEQLDLTTANGGEAGLAQIDSEDLFAVVVSDMRMPGMDGVAFLAEVKQRSPESVRIMLTGNADLQTAVTAINEGHIFRFLTKPCPAEQFAAAVESAIKQHHLIMAERELLRDTVAGCIKVLTEVLELMNPEAFGRTSRIRRIVKHIARQIRLEDVWEFEMAGALSQLGCVSLPPDLLRRMLKSETLTREEHRLLDTHPEAARQLLENVPRMESIAQIISRQKDAFWTYQINGNQAEPTREELGAQILKIAIDLDEQIRRGVSFDVAWRKMASQKKEYNPEILDALMDLHVNEQTEEISEVGTDELCVGMVSCNGICTIDGSQVVQPGQEISYPILQRLRRFAEEKRIVEPFRVQVGGWVAVGSVREQSTVTVQS